MSYLRAQLNIADEACDKCGKPMTTEDPGVVLQAYSEEAGHNKIWAHIECLQNLLFKMHKEQAIALKFQQTPKPEQAEK